MDSIEVHYVPPSKYCSCAANWADAVEANYCRYCSKPIAEVKAGA